VATVGVVEALDEVEDGQPSLAVRSEALPVEQLARERGEEALTQRVDAPIAVKLARSWLREASERPRAPGTASSSG
jgi:hypothetical protein